MPLLTPIHTRKASFWITVVSLTFLCLINGVAQDVPIASKTLSPIKTDSLYFIDDWVIPSSIKIEVKSKTLSSSNWQYNSDSRSIQFLATPDFNFENVESIKVLFDVHPYSLKRVYQNTALAELDSSLLNNDENVSITRKPLNNYSANSNLTQRGSLSRGIIVGTNQDFALESGLNFELKGVLTDNVNINAVLTDKSIPIQPDGTTQNLKEFDKVFIQIEAPNSKLEMGDIDVSFNASSFAQLNRRLQGVTGNNIGESYKISAAASVVRGTYKRISLNGLEGVQGPYRLTGNENDEFVIVLAGTERVYINGEQLQRGEDRDYIIDYGLGEIHFTNNQLIKDETRIVVEYEYIIQNFNRTLVAGESKSSFLNNRFTIGATVIRQADGNNLLSQRTLTESDIDILKQTGDNLSNAQVSGATIADDSDKTNVLYAKIDTTFDGQVYSIFKNKPRDEGAIYRVQFSKVSANQGSYERASNSVNGLVYEWVGPNNGNYVPYRNLPAPQKHQMATLNGEFKVNKNIIVFGEYAVSDFDKNRFSSLDSNDDVDVAYLSGVKIKKLPVSSGFLDVEAKRRFTGRNFEFFERTKEVEFDRKWNISSIVQSEEAINELKANYSLSDYMNIGGELGVISRANFKGTRQASMFSTSTKNGLDLKYAQDWVQSSDKLIQIDGNWLRQNANISKPMINTENLTFKPYLGFAHEKRIQTNSITDSLTNQALRFYELTTGIQFSNSKWKMDYSIGYRDEYRVQQNKLEKEFYALQHSFVINYTPSSNFNTRNKITLRDKRISEEFKTSENNNKKALLIRSNTDYETKDNIWAGNFLYEVNTQRQSLLQETYIEVGPEIGQYTWTDLNNDGIEQVDEFFPELTPNEGTYLKQYLPSDELLPVIDLRTRLRNRIVLFSFLKDKEKSITEFLSQIILNSRIDIRENSTTQNLEDVYFLNLKSFRDTLKTISGTISLEKELDVLPAYSDYDLLVRYNESRSLNKRSSELQKRYMNALATEFSYNLSSKIDGITKYHRSTNSTSSNTITNRNFNINSNSFEQAFNFTINRSWRTGISTNYTNKVDETDKFSSAKAKIVKIRNTNRFFLLKKVQANTTFEIRNVSINGATNAISNYELTEGFGKGFNVQWSLNSSYRVNNLLRFNLIYDGRTVQDRPTIHTARLTVKANF